MNIPKAMFKVTIGRTEKGKYMTDNWDGVTLLAKTADEALKQVCLKKDEFFSSVALIIRED